MPHVFRRCRWLFAVLCATTVPAQQPAPAAAPPVETQSIEGRVVDMRGDGVPAAQVWIATWNAPDAVLARSGADGDGYFRIAKVPKVEGLRVCAKAPGFAIGRASPSSTLVAEVLLTHAGTLTGTLRNRAGQPVADVPVRARLYTRVLHDVGSDARTDAEGRFTLPDVPLGPVVVSAWIPGEGAAEREVWLRDAQTVELQTSAGATTTLKVEVKGLPEPFPADVQLFVLPFRSGGGRLPPPYDLLRLDGPVCRLELVPDCDYGLALNSPNFVFSTRQAQVAKGSGPHEVVFVSLSTNDASVTCPVAVGDGDGKPVAGLGLVLSAADDGREIGGRRERATTDAEGKATLTSPVTANAAAIVQCDDDRWVMDQTKDARRILRNLRSLTQHELVVDPSRTTTLRVVPAASVRGRVVLADGRPAVFVDVDLQWRQTTSPDGWRTVVSSSTDRDGTFQFRRLHAFTDPIRVVVRSRFGEGSSPELDLGQVGAQLQVDDLKLGEPAVVAGRVLDGERRPAAGIRVLLRDWDIARNAQRSSTAIETITDRDGRYRFLGVALGGAYLQLAPPVGSARVREKAVEPFEVEARKTYTFDLQLPK